MDINAECNGQGRLYACRRELETEVVREGHGFVAKFCDRVRDVWSRVLPKFESVFLSKESWRESKNHDFRESDNKNGLRSQVL